MRRLFLAAAIAAAVMFAAGSASAQVRIQTYVAAPKLLRTVPAVKIPLIIVIPPSLALSRAMAIAPNSRALGVKLHGSLYIVKLKQGNRVMQVRVNAATGAVSP